ncbi:hypothetical protein P5706_20075 [Pseudomonas sp. ChxA]|uniref:hypothetical protein n=1 Tax=Pseudomonas sp. ChxA TaxID=3035473 RepID=UPI0025540F87|nr:hypothetical protein [Pseudomonas sp. ChxA]MDL2186489.1 hypothetical protein [Pseudomonas sp. ChxA]
MPITPNSFPLTGSPALYNTDNPHHRVPINQVLADSTDAIFGRHQVTVQRVSKREMKALTVGNQAIDDTWRILNKGSGNQQRHIVRTNGDSFKRTGLAQTEFKQMGRDGWDRARIAARFQAGNCSEMASVCAALCATSGLNRPVSVLYSTQRDHAVTEIGDHRMSEGSVIVDAWPDFGRAMRRQDFALIDQQPMLLNHFEPRQDPGLRNRLLYDAKASQAEVDHNFRLIAPNMPSDGDKLVKHALNQGGVYAQRHTAKNLGMHYHYKSSKGESQYLDLNLSQAQFKDRLTQLGLDPKTGNVPSKSLFAPLMRAIGSARARTPSVSATAAPVIVPWEAPAVRPRHASTAAAERPRAPHEERRREPSVEPRSRATATADTRAPRAERYRSASVDPRGRAPAPAPRAPRESRREPEIDSRGRRTTEAPRASRSERHREPSADVRSRPAESSRAHRHTSRDRHPMATPARRERADTFIATLNRRPGG